MLIFKIILWMAIGAIGLFLLLLFALVLYVGAKTLWSFRDGLF